MQITGPGLLKLVKALPKLRFFDLQKCINVGDDFLVQLPKVAKNIDFLQLRGLTSGSAKRPLFLTVSYITLHIILASAGTHAIRGAVSQLLQYVSGMDEPPLYYVELLSTSFLCHQ